MPPRRRQNRRRGRKAKRTLKYPDSRNAKTLGLYTTLQAGASQDGTKPAFNQTGLLLIGQGLIAGTVGQVAGSFQFQVGQCPAWISLSSGWDRYRVNKIHVRIIPSVSQALVGGAPALPVMRVVRDFDDNATSVSVSGGGANRSLFPQDIWARRGREFRLNSPKTFSFVPKISQTAMNASSTGASTILANATSVKCPWLNVTQPLINMYGLKWAVKNFNVPPVGAGQAPNLIQFEITFDISFSQQQYLSSGVFPSMTEMGMPFGLPVPCYYYTNEGVYDEADNLLAQPDLSGNEIPVV